MNESIYYYFFLFHSLLHWVHELPPLMWILKWHPWRDFLAGVVNVTLCFPLSYGNPMSNTRIPSIHPCDGLYVCLHRRHYNTARCLLPASQYPIKSALVLLLYFLFLSNSCPHAQSHRDVRITEI